MRVNFILVVGDDLPSYNAVSSFPVRSIMLTDPASPSGLVVDTCQYILSETTHTFRLLIVIKLNQRNKLFPERMAAERFASRKRVLASSTSSAVTSLEPVLPNAQMELGDNN